MPDINTDISKAAKDIANVAKDATYVVIGAGVLGFQQAQVQRRELMAKLQEPSTLAERVSAVRGDLTDAVHQVDTRVEDLMDRFEEIIERVEAVFAPFEDRLPARPGTSPSRRTSRPRTPAHSCAACARRPPPERRRPTSGRTPPPPGAAPAAHEPR